MNFVDVGFSGFLLVFRRWVLVIERNLSIEVYVFVLNFVILEGR